MATVKEVAEHLGITHTWVTELTNQGVLPKAKGRKGRDLGECVRRYLAHKDETISKLRSNKGIEDPELDELREEKILLTRSQRQKIDLAYQRELGELVPAELIAFIIGKVAPDVAGILDTIPLKVQRRHPDITPGQMTTIQTEIAKAMNLMAETAEKTPEYIREYLAQQAAG